MKRQIKYAVLTCAFAASAATTFVGGHSVASAAPNGKGIFGSNCASCHGADGKGSGSFPALAGNAHVTAKDASGIISTVEHGKNAMPAFKGNLSNADIAAVLTYIRSAWGNKAGPVSDKDVAAVK